jgi:hypothetical protein
MMIALSFLSNAGWLFMSLWSAIVAAVGLTAFGRDLLPTGLQSAAQRQRKPQPPPR